MNAPNATRDRSADLQIVLRAIARTAAKVCEANDALIILVQGDKAAVVARHGFLPTRHKLGEAYPLTDDMVGNRVITQRRTIHLRDLSKAPRGRFVGSKAAHLPLGVRTMLVTPLLRDGDAIGAIGIRRTKVQPFTPKQVALLKTFANQAAIAIENARLFTELQEKNSALTAAHAQVTESLEQQTTTSEILRVISSSPNDVQPVFDAIAKNGTTLCDAAWGAVIRFDGQLLTLMAQHNMTPSELELISRTYPRTPTRGRAPGRAIIDRRTVHVPDIREDPDYLSPFQQALGVRTVLAVPMLRDGEPIGVLALWRREVRQFTDQQIALVETFADQAVIAIENVRLFNELKDKNGALAEALEQQTATSELLKVIGRSTFDLQPVFETLAANAIRLCEAERALIFRFDGQVMRVVATHNVFPELRAFIEQNPITPGRGSGIGRAALERRTIHIHDIRTDPEYTYAGQQIAPYRTVLVVPMLRAGELLGIIAIHRHEVRPFMHSQITLMETFADQAAIAIENTQLFKELEARTAQLSRSVQELQALGEVSQALSSTLDLETVLSTIVARANQLAGTDGGSVYEYDEPSEAFHLRATDNLDEEVVVLARHTPVPRSEGVLGRMAVTREPVQIPDIGEESAYHSPLRDVLLRTGTRALLAIPLLREDHLIGGLTVNKKTPGEFSPQVIDLLKTFASQSALAIQNARLFLEIEDKSRQLEAASQHKSDFLANMSHELRTPLNAIIGFSEVLGERLFGDLNEKQEEYLKDIHASGQHLLSLINDILDLSKIEAGRMELELTDFDLPTAIDNALTLVRERAGRRGIALHQAADEGVGQTRGDERKIKQVLLNLLSNAIKFTPDGGRIAVRARPVDGSVEVSVSDTGVGIAPEDQEAIFEEFRQVGTAAKKVEGTGLGLALSRKFVELHGGRIEVQSQLGVGSTFTFTIPRIGT